MASLTSSLDRKYFQALVNGVTKLFVYQDPSVSLKVIRDQIFGGSDDPASEALIEALARIVRAAAGGNWTVTELEDRLKNTDIRDEHAQVMLKFWTGERAKVHAHAARRATWNRTLDGRLGWRVDARHASKASHRAGASKDDSKDDKAEESRGGNDGVGRLAAMFSLSTRPGAGHSDGEAPLLWEMDRAQLQGLVEQFDRIAAAVKRAQGVGSDGPVPVA
jgi:hypothetical protein